VKYVAPSTNWAAFNLRALDGAYTDRALDAAALLDDGFRLTEPERSHRMSRASSSGWREN
jgi:hypothetical protein